MLRKLLAGQLRKPRGIFGKHLGKKMSKFNNEANELILKLLNVQSEHRILEIGFGPGELIHKLAQKASNGMVAGIDFSREMYKMAVQRNHEAIQSRQVQLHCCSAEQIPYQEDFFDRVFAVNVLFFWKNPTQYLSEIRRVLKPGGQCGLYIVAKESWWKGFAKTGIFHPYNEDDLAQFLTAAKFQNIRCERKHMNEGIGIIAIARK